MFHRQRDAIEAHLIVVFAALAITRYLTGTTGASIKKIVRTLKPLRTVDIQINKQTLTAAPVIHDDARAILHHLPPINTPGH